MPTIGLKITGLVQGVFFRAEAQTRAQELKLSGWVRNCEDGSVEIHAEGSEESLRKLEEWCQVGPTAAKVEHVEKEKVEAEDCTGFEVRC